MRDFRDTLPDALTEKVFTNADLVGGTLPKELAMKVGMQVSFQDCFKSKFLPLLSPHLQELNIWGSEITTLDLATKPELKFSEIIGCENLKFLTLPSSLESFRIQQSAIESCDFTATTKLRELYLMGCKELKFPTNIPASLRKLYLNESGIETLDLASATNLEELGLSWCQKLTSLTSLPNSLKKINLCYCTSLPQTSELATRLLELEASGCDVTFPEHWNLNQEAANAKVQLEDVITEYKTSHPDLPEPSAIKTILHRFTNEGVGTEDKPGARGSIREIIQAVNPVLKVFKKDPDHLEWAEEVAKNYLTGCVNQPVTGWSEICALTAMASETTVKDKIDASTQLIAFVALTEHIATLPKEEKPGTMFEVEAANVLMREIHQRLKKDGLISEDWLGVPVKVRYEETLNAGFLRLEKREDSISAAYEAVKKAINKTPEQKTDFLCEGHYLEAWRQIAFPSEVAAIKKKYAEKLKEISDKAGEIDLTQSEELKKIGEERAATEEEMKKEIAEMVREKTKEAINPQGKTSSVDRLRNEVKENKNTFASRFRKLTEGVRNLIPKEFSAGNVAASSSSSSSSSSSLPAVNRDAESPPTPPAITSNARRTSRLNNAPSPNLDDHNNSRF